nr:unnamed protein product [Callosobruchus analis]
MKSTVCLVKSLKGWIFWMSSTKLSVILMIGHTKMLGLHIQLYWMIHTLIQSIWR